MMNNDEEFQQRWEFRCKENDSSSNESKSSLSGTEQSDKKLKLANALVLLPENELSDAPKCDNHAANDDVSKPAKAAPKRKARAPKKDKPDAKNNVSKPAKKAPKAKAAPRAKKNSTVPSEKPKRSLLVKENKKRKKNCDSKDMVMFEDLKMFGESLIHELSVAREEMSEQMREAARTFVASTPVLGCERKKGACVQNKKAQPQKRAKLNVKAQKQSKGSLKTSIKPDTVKAVKGRKKQDKVPESGKANEITSLEASGATDTGKFPLLELQKGEGMMAPMTPHMLLSTDSSRVVTTPFSTLPTMVPTSQLQNPRNGIPTNIGSEMEIGKLTDAKTGNLGFPPGFNLGERFGSFPCFGRRAPGLSIESCSQTAGIGIGFPVPLHQGMGIGSNMPECSFGVNAGPRNNISSSKFGSGNQAFSEYVLANKMQQKGGGEFVSLTSKDVMKDNHVCVATLRNKE